MTVTNSGTQLHTLTIPKLRVDSGTVQPGATVELTFTAPGEPGRYDFICALAGHEEAGMIGRLVVT